MVKRSLPPSSTRPSARISTLSSSPRCHCAGAIESGAPPSAQRGGTLGAQPGRSDKHENDTHAEAKERRFTRPRIARSEAPREHQRLVALTKYSYSSGLLVRLRRVVTVAPRKPHNSKISAKMRSTGKSTSKNFEFPTT